MSRRATPHIETPQSERLPLMLKVSWGVGGLGTTSMLYLLSTFVVFFLVRHVGVPAAIATSLLAATRLYDALINPVVGSLSDRSASRWGRRRPWMLAGAVLAPLGCLAVFHPPALPPGPALYVAIFVALALFCTAYSLFAIPFSALGAEMTDDYGERASVMAWRTFWVYTAGIVITAGAPAMIKWLGSDRAAYGAMSWVAAAVIGATMFWVVAFSAGARVTVRSLHTVSALASLRTALSNKPFLIVLLTKMMGQLGTAFLGASTLFFMHDVLRRDEGALAILGLVSNVIGVISVPVWGRLLRHYERRPLLIGMLSANALTYLSWFIASPTEPQAIFVVRAFLLGALGAGSVLVAMAMIADTIEYDRLRTGLRREGLFFGALELMQTTSFVLGPLLTGVAFAAAGLKSGHIAAGAQPPQAIMMIRIAMSFVPAACSLAGVALALRYPLDAIKLAAMREASDRAAAAQRSPPLPSTMNANASRAV